LSLPLPENDTLVDGDLCLHLDRIDPADPVRWNSPAYQFLLIHTRDGEVMGHISLRVSNNNDIVQYAGHVGYGVLPQFRGHRYAARACRLLLPLAKSVGLNPLWITCNPENRASRRTCELVGAELVDIVTAPDGSPMAIRGEPTKCRYKVDL
jgi:predicted acetyltransferase